METKQVTYATLVLLGALVGSLIPVSFGTPLPFIVLALFAGCFSTKQKIGIVMGIYCVDIVMSLHYWAALFLMAITTTNNNTIGATVYFVGMMNVAGLISYSIAKKLIEKSKLKERFPCII